MEYRNMKKRAEKTPHEANCEHHPELAKRKLRLHPQSAIWPTLDAKDVSLGLYEWSDTPIPESKALVGNRNGRDIFQTTQALFRIDHDAPSSEQITQCNAEKLNTIGHYQFDLFRPVFMTHDIALASRIGREFAVLDRLLSWHTLVYLIHFEDGTQVHAWPSEVCVPIKRQRNKPITSPDAP
jgi:hypothetical protein